MPLRDHVQQIILNAKGYLELDNAGIFDSDVDELCSLIKKNGSVMFLSLFNNNLGDKGAARLATMLPLIVRTIDLRRNNISDVGAIALISNPQFESLTFTQSGDEITEKTGEEILKSTYLLDVDLKGTELSENLNMMAMIKKKLEENKALKASREISNGTATQSSYEIIYKGVSISTFVDGTFTRTIVRPVKDNIAPDNESRKVSMHPRDNG